jgi:hypothetical protein
MVKRINNKFKILGIDMNIGRIFELAGVNNELLLEAPTYDGMIASLKKNFPNSVKEIDDNIKQAKSILVKGDRIVWYIKILRAYLNNDINRVKGTYNFKDMETFNNDLFHYYGFNIGEIVNTELVNQNISELFGSFQGYVDKYQKSPKAPVPVKEGDYQLIPKPPAKFTDGSSWWFIDRGFCEEEGRSGKHCGNVMGQHDTSQRILSLRTANHNVILTFILEKNGYLGEMKAVANQKPAEKYHYQIMQLLLNPIVKGITGAGHHPWMNFSVFDLPESEINVLIKHGKESFIIDQIISEPIEFLKAPSYIKNNPEYQQMAVKALPALEPLIGKENDLGAWRQAIQRKGGMIIYAPENYPKFKEEVISYLKYRPSELVHVPKTVSHNFDILKAVIEDNGNYIEYVLPNTPRYTELCKIAVSNSGYAIEYVPEEMRTLEICKIAVSKNGESLYYVPEEFRTLELCKIAVSNNGNALYGVPEKLKTLEICKIAVSKKGDALELVPEKLKTSEICKIAVSNEGHAIKYVPEELKTVELCKIAIKTAGSLLQYVPEEMRTLELCKIAVSNDDWALYFVPDHLKDKVKQELNIQESLDFSYFRML